MAKEVLLSSPAQKQFIALEGETKRSVRKALPRLAESGTGDVKKLAVPKDKERLFRLRVGDYRIVFSQDDRNIFVINIFHRGKCYDWL